MWMCPEMLGGKAKCRSGSGSDGDESEGLMDAEDSTKGKNKGGIPKAVYAVGALVFVLFAYRFMGSVRAAPHTLNQPA